MKRTERRHLKENELAALALNAKEAFETRRREFTIAALVLVAAVLGVLGYLGWRSSQQNRAGALLTDALTVSEARVGPPPAPGAPAAGLSFPTEAEKQQAALAKFKAVADRFPNTDAGMFARYREAATLMALGKPSEAAAVYQQVIDRAGDAIYGQMAQLGLAEAQARSGQHDQAIELYKRLAENTEGPLPVDGVLMQLGRTYLDAGKTAEAQQTFNRVVEEFPDSPFTAEARRELDSLKKT
jgi:TolA-binding protein